MNVLSLAGVVAPILFILVTLVAGASQEGYDHIDQFVSELGATGAPTASLMNYAGFIPTGAMLTLFGVAVTQYLTRDKVSLVAGILLTFFGIGVLLAGVFSCDLGCPQSGGSLENTIHDRISPLAFLAAIVAISLLSFRFRRTSEWNQFWIYSLLTATLALASFIGIVSSLETRSYTGLWQRFMLLTLFAWIAVVGLRMYRLQHQSVAP